MCRQSEQLFVFLAVRDVDSKQGGMFPIEGIVGVSMLPFQIILPWLTLSEKVHQQIRALGTISRMLRFICNFPRLSVSAWGGRKG